MSDTRESMSVWEAEDRAMQAADELEKLLQEFDGEDYQEDPGRHDYFASQCMSILADNFSIPAPTHAVMERE